MFRYQERESARWMDIAQAQSIEMSSLPGKPRLVSTAPDCASAASVSENASAITFPNGNRNAMFIHHRRVPSSAALFVGLLLAGFLACSSASATISCVSSVSQLNVALAVGTFQTQPYTIKIVQGTYLMDASVNTIFTSPTTIEGGYTAGCADRTVNPSNTVIDIGIGHFFSLGQYAGDPQAQLNIDGLTFEHTEAPMGLDAGGPSGGRLNITHSIIHGIRTPTQYPLSLGSTGGAVNIDNVLLYDIFTFTSSPLNCAVRIYLGSDASARINHVTANIGNDNDFCIDAPGQASSVSIYNSILWASGNQFTTLRELSGSHANITIANSIYMAFLLNNPPTQFNSISSDPQWTNVVGDDYHLQSASPAVNSGTAIVSGGEPATDIEGNARLIGGAPDRGAYESNVNNETVLTVTNTLDSGPGSLRQAMLSANANPSIPQSIKFNIRTANQTPICPAVIALNSTLPAIDSPMTIDGYTQPLSLANTSEGDFNANLCILVRPASGTLNTGFKVLSTAGATASLALRGIGIGGFNLPLSLIGGQNHVITGNQFGGVANGQNLPGAGLSAISVGVSATGSLIIGGSNAADRNVIGGAGNSGVSIQSTVVSSPVRCQIVNNLIGLAPDGVFALPNSFGIDASGSGCMIASNRVAGNSIINLWLQGDFNIAQKNSVGFNITGNGFSTNTTGILVQGANNIIGAIGNGGSISANTVRNNLAGGVVVKGDTAVDNSIQGNRIYDNGPSSAGMDIDLVPTGGTVGPTPNDPTDSDFGPNDLQNFPVLKGLVYTAVNATERDATVTAQLVTNPGTYRVDVYFSNAINPLGKRGHAEGIAAYTTVQVPASGRTSFTVPIIVSNQVTAGVFSMTATSISGSTSEIGTAMSFDTLFVDGVD